MEALRSLSPKEALSSHSLDVLPFKGGEISVELGDNLRQLEEDFAFFQFAIGEIKDLTKN